MESEEIFSNRVKNTPIYVAIAWIPNVITASLSYHNGIITLIKLKFAATTPPERRQ